MIEELLNKINELFSRLTTPSRDPSDIVVVLVLLWLLSQSRTQFPQLPQYPITIPPPKRQFTVSEIEQMIKQCERSANPLECIKNMLYGG
jgi:hypothetical protein